MSPELERLIGLQRLESTIADARARVAGHPQRIQEGEARVETARQAVEGAKARLKEGQDARRLLEKDAATYQARLTKFKDQLSEVKTNREYTAMQHEIEVAQRDLGAAEERVLERMMEADAVAAEVKSAEAAVAAVQKEVATERAELDAEAAEVETTLQAALAKRTAMLQGLEPRIVNLFEQVAKARKGIFLSMATRDGLCSVCHVRLRPQVFQLVRQNSSIMQCDSCQRILYYIPPPPPVEQAVTHRS